MFKVVLFLFLTNLIRCNTGLNLTTATVRDVQQAIQSYSSTCRQIIQGYLQRINAYNRAGPQIGGVISTNPNAIQEAIRLDNYFGQTRTLIGILHCAPLLVKDNIDVAGLATTNGLYAFSNMCPQFDAESVANAKRAGAIVIGKANMSPFASKEAWGNSETGGLIRNPYGLSYTTYGSSGGNGASGAAMFSILGFATETGVSVNLPASAANLVGLRPPVPLVSQEGVMPNSAPQDVVGPMAKTVEDVALLLDAEVGNFQTRRYSAPSVLREDGLRGMRINIFQMFTYDQFEVPGFGRYAVDPQILSLFNAMISNMVTAGAAIRNASIDASRATPRVIQMLTNATYDACLVAWRDKYFGNRMRYNNQAPYHSVADVVRSQRLPKIYQDVWSRDLNNSNAARCTQQLQSYLTDRNNFIADVLNPLLQDAQVAVWPTMPIFPPKLGGDALNKQWDSRNEPPINLINAGSWTAFPTIDVPIGFGLPLQDAPGGLPAAAIMIARPENLNTLLTVAYAYQKRFGISRVPYSTPELPQNCC